MNRFKPWKEPHIRIRIDPSNRAEPVRIENHVRESAWWRFACSVAVFIFVLAVAALLSIDGWGPERPQRDQRWTPRPPPQQGMHHSRKP